MGGILMNGEALLEDMFAYYKFGRHERAFPEKPYFLLSYCTHLLFLLWRTEQDSGGNLFQKTRRPAAFQVNLDFGTLREAEHARRMPHASPLVEHLKNEPQWFMLWLNLLDRLGSSRTAAYHEFSQQMLAQVKQRGFTGARPSRKSKKRRDDLMKSDEAGCFLLRSVSVLEDLVLTLSSHVANLDPRDHVIEQVLSLICLLGRIRQIIICEMPASGPCRLQDAKRWAMPLLLRRLCLGRRQGVLTVIPKREGGGVICTYSVVSGSGQQRNWSWSIKTSALAGSYEESLFETWPCNANERQKEGADPCDGRASWLVQSAEAQHLETISKHVDTLLYTLGKNRLYHGLVGAVAGVARNKRARWKPAQLRWTHIWQLDQVLEQLRYLFRKATVTGGNCPADRLASQIWPVP